MSFTAQNKPERKIRVKLMVGEYSGRVYYAEAGGDFVDLLFSFLTVPLGYIFQKLQGRSVGGCLSHLHSSVANLDTENYLKSEEHKETLLSPKLAPGFGYDEQLLEIEEALSEPLYVFKIDSFNRRVTTDATIASQRSATPVTLTGLKTQCGEASDRNRGVYVKGGTQFTVTDDLVIAPVSSISGFSVLKKLHVPLTDLVQRDVHVGKGEALNLLLASFASESALTDAFMDQIQV